MKLIDADALAKELMHEGLGYQYNRVINAPTVDAIPIEWIEETMQLAETVGAKEYAEHLEVLLDDWAEREEE